MNLQEYDESEMVIVIDTREKVPFFYSNIDNPRFPGLKIKYDTLEKWRLQFSRYECP